MSLPSPHRRFTRSVADLLDVTIFDGDTIYALQNHLDYYKSDMYSESHLLLIADTIRAQHGKSPYAYDGDLVQEELNYLGGLVNGAFVGQSSQSIARLLCEFVRRQLMDSDVINSILEEGAFFFRIVPREPIPYIEFLGDVDHESLSEGAVPEPQLHKTMDRMDDCFRRQDFAGVLAAGSNVLEAIGRAHSKHPYSNKVPFNKVMKSFKKYSPLPSAMKDEMEKIYNSRNTTPNAGHGCIEVAPGTTRKEAIVVICVCYAAVKGHYLSSS